MVPLVFPSVTFSGNTGFEQTTPREVDSVDVIIASAASYEHCFSEFRAFPIRMCMNCLRASYSWYALHCNANETIWNHPVNLINTAALYLLIIAPFSQRDSSGGTEK